MRIHFRNGDLAFRPESRAEVDALIGFYEALKTAQFDPSPLGALENIAKIYGGDVSRIKSNNEQSVPVPQVHG